MLTHEKRHSGTGCWMRASKAERIKKKSHQSEKCNFTVVNGNELTLLLWSLYGVPSMGDVSFLIFEKKNRLKNNK